jgi:hypothetical protein
MAKVTFQRWAIDKNGRHPISVEPSRVDVIEYYQDKCADTTKYGPQIAVWWDEDVRFPVHNYIPAATKIIMQGKQEFFVQGTVEEVTKAINEAK